MSSTVTAPATTRGRSAHRAPATRHHLHEVFAALDAHVDEAASAWRRIVYIDGSVTIETEPADLAAMCLAFALAVPAPELPATAVGETHAVVCYASTGTIDGAPLRVCARDLVTMVEYHTMMDRLRALRAHR